MGMYNMVHPSGIAYSLRSACERDTYVLDEIQERCGQQSNTQNENRFSRDCIGYMHPRTDPLDQLGNDSSCDFCCLYPDEHIGVCVYLQKVKQSST